VFALSVPGLALIIVLGLVAVGAIAWLLSPKDLSIDLDAFSRSDDDGARPRSGP
jgi:hypothetical protein